MRRLVIPLVLIVIAAGCTAPGADVAPADVIDEDPNVTVVARPAASADGDGAAVPAPDVGASPAVVLPPPARLPFGEPVELPLLDGFGGGEPNIAALPDGTLFATSPTGAAPPNALEGGGYLWRSTDGGATWDMLRGPDCPAACAFCSCDSDVVASEDGWVYYTDWWIAGFAGPGNYLVERSSDGGETWEATPITTREALLSLVDRQWLVAGADGFVGLFYSYRLFNAGLPLSDLQSGVHAVFSMDHGATWGQPVVVLAGGAWQIAHPQMMPDGSIVMPYGLVPDANEFWRDPSVVMLAVSTDQGLTWEHREVAKAPEGFDNLWAVQAAVDARGAVHVAWSARVDDDHMATYVATSRDAGVTWTAPLALRSNGGNFLPWAATFGNDTVAVGWYGGDATGDPAGSKSDALWFAFVAQSTDGGETFVVQRVSDDPVKEGDLCPRGAACEGDRELLDYVSMVYDAQGNLHYAFARSEDDVAHTLVATALTGASA